MKNYEPKLVCFSCRFSWGYVADEISLSRQVKNWIPIICSGKIESTHILSAFQHGADGVLILGCPEGDCHYQDGNFEGKKRVYLPAPSAGILWHREGKAGDQAVS